jgi:hypothetical protein
MQRKRQSYGNKLVGGSMWCSYCEIDVEDDSKHLIDDPALGWIHNRAEDPGAWHTVEGTRVQVTKLADGGSDFGWYHGGERAPGEGIRAPGNGKRAVRLDRPDGNL